MSKKFFSVFIIFMILSALFAASACAAVSGRTVWNFAIDSELNSGITSGIAVAGDLVLAGDGTGKFYAINKNTGQLAWSYLGKNSIVGTPAVADGKVIFVQADGSIICLNLSNGAPVWVFEADVEGMGLTIVDGAAVGDGKVYVAKGDGALYAMNLADGSSAWKYKSSSYELRTAPTFGAGFVMLGEQSGKFSMIDPKSGKRISGGGAGGAVNTPVINDGDVYFSSWDGSVQRVQIKGIVPKWNTKVNDPVTTKPVIGGGRVFVGTANGLVAALSVEGGNMLWRYETNGGTVSATPVLIGDALIVTGGQGTIFVLDAATGRPRNEFNAGASSVNPAFDNGTLFIAVSGGIAAIR